MGGELGSRLSDTVRQRNGASTYPSGSNASRQTDGRPAAALAAAFERELESLRSARGLVAGPQLCAACLGPRTPPRTPSRSPLQSGDA